MSVGDDVRFSGESRPSDWSVGLGSPSGAWISVCQLYRFLLWRTFEIGGAAAPLVFGMLNPSKANALKPGKRPAHTLNSYMVFRNGEFFAVGGTPGNDDQPQSNVQILYNLLDRDMDPQAAIEAPRWSHMPGTPPRLELPEGLSLEEGFAPEVGAGLQQRGHKVKVVGRWSFGAAQVIVRDAVDGTWMGGADPRREGYAIGW